MPLFSTLFCGQLVYEDWKSRNRNCQVAPREHPDSPGFSDDVQHLRQIVETLSDFVPDFRQLLSPIAVGIHRTARAKVVVAGRIGDDLLQWRELLDAEFLETDGIALDLLGEFGDIEHFLFGFGDVAVDEIPMQPKIELRQDGEGIAYLLLGCAFFKLFQYAVVG